MVWRGWLAFGFVVVLCAASGIDTVAAAASPAVSPANHWVGTWSAAEVQPDVTGPSATGFANQTIREVVHTGIGGSQLRLRFSNGFGTRPLSVVVAEVGVSQSGVDVAPGSNHPVTVGGSPSFVIPAGGSARSDPVGLTTAPGSDLAVSVYLSAPTGPATWHPVALTTSYIAVGNHTTDTMMPYQASASSWFFLSGVDVSAPAASVGVVAFGASTTDGLGSTFNANRRWLDDLNARVEAADPAAPASVTNEGISGNRLLTDGRTSGQSGETRFARDVLGQSGARTVIVSSLGNNDIGDKVGSNGQAITAGAMIAGYQQLIAHAHRAGLTIVGGTITPDEGAYYYTPAGGAVRQQVNSWILTSGAFDATIDFAGAVADPTDPSRLLAGYDAGDHLHLNDTGYRAMAQSVSLSLLGGDPIVDHYQALGAASSFLGSPIGPEQTVGPGRTQAYQGGTIDWSPATGAHEVHGVILRHYRTMGGPAGILGFPVTDETGTPDGIGRFNHFANDGSIYWTPATGAWSVHGAIRDHWRALGWERSALGYPVSDQQATRGVGGRFNNFQGGVIDWSPATGAFEVQGAILNRYLSLGGTASFLGFPTSDEYQVGTDGRRSDFQHGYISFSFTTGAIVVG